MKTYILIATFLIASFTNIASQTPNEQDFQFRNETKVYFPSITREDKNGKKQKFISPHFIGVVRVGQNVKHFINERVGFGIDVRISKHFKFSTSYLYIADQPTKNKKGFENRVRFSITAEKKWKKFSLSNRNRIERRFRHGRANSTRYRNKTTLKVPVKTAEGKEIITPFVATEPHYDFSKDKWTRNEFSTGIGKKLSSSTSATFFYLFQNNTGSTLKRVHGFGVNLKFTVD